MSTEIYTKCDSLSLTNMMYRRLISFACDFARQQVPSSQELIWIEKFAQLEEKSGQEVSLNEIFFTADEVKYWSLVFFECTQAVYDRQLGNQEDQKWQISTIWAMYSVARMLATEFSSRDNAL